MLLKLNDVRGQDEAMCGGGLMLVQHWRLYDTLSQLWVTTSNVRREGVKTTGDPQPSVLSMLEYYLKQLLGITSIFIFNFVMK